MPLTPPTDPSVFLDDGTAAVTASGYGQVDGSPAVYDLGALATTWTGVLVIDVLAIDTASGDETYFVSVEGSDSSSFTGTPQALQNVEVAVTGQLILPVSALFLGHFYRYLRGAKTISGTTPSLQVRMWLASYSALPDLTLAELITLNGVASLNLTQLSASLLGWVTGTVDGGPDGDGRYPLNDAAGNTFLVPCPAKTLAGALLAGNDLSEVDPAMARDNLDVYSKEEVDAGFAALDDVYSKPDADGRYVRNLGGAPTVQEGDHASRPAAGNAGAIYVETDTRTIWRDDGSAWRAIGGGFLGFAFEKDLATASPGVALVDFTSALAWTLPAGLGLCAVRLSDDGTAPSAQTDFDLQHNGSSVGTIRFAASGVTASFIKASDTSVAANAKVQIVPPAGLNGMTGRLYGSIVGQR